MSADNKAAAAWDDYVSQQQEEKIEELERQLNAANQRIKQLEDARTVAAANSLANMLAYEDAVAKIKRLGREVELLRFYGNKDCTAQADEVLKKEDKP